MNTSHQLFDACAKGQLEEVRRLVRAGVPLDFQCNNRASREFGLTPLHFATGNGHLPVVEYIVRAGAPLNVKCKFGLTPLHYAARDNHSLIVKCLVRAGASINAKENMGWTPLHYAVSVEDSGIISAKVLLEKGADYAICDECGKTAKNVAQQCGNDHIVNLLQEYEDDIPDVKEPAFD